MPTYDYKCRKCGNAFEARQTMSESLLKSCPKCKGKVDRLIGAGAGLIFKGTGFYSTDYKKTSPPAPPKKETPKESAPKKKETPSE
jgi:putative FmdB family regulatory protein